MIARFQTVLFTGSLLVVSLLSHQLFAQSAVEMHDQHIAARDADARETALREALAAVARDKAEDVVNRRRAVVGLGNLGAASAEVLSDLVFDKAVHYHVVDALAKTGDSGLEALGKAALMSDDDLVRAVAVRGIQAIGTKTIDLETLHRAVAILRQVGMSASPVIRATAIAALVSMTTAGVTEPPPPGNGGQPAGEKPACPTVTVTTTVSSGGTVVATPGITQQQTTTEPANGGRGGGTTTDEE